jgi:hypothetical protein
MDHQSQMSRVRPLTQSNLLHKNNQEDAIASRGDPTIQGNPQGFFKNNEQYQA